MTQICHRCGALLTPGTGSFYLARIEAFADPTPPAIDTSEPRERIEADIEALLEQLRTQSEQEMRDQVYRRLTVYLCTPCYRTWIENPTG